MGLCKDCNYWSYTVNNRKGCNLVDWMDERGSIKDNEMGFFASADNDSGLYGGVIAGPMFGCVNFKEVDNE